MFQIKQNNKQKSTILLHLHQHRPTVNATKHEPFKIRSVERVNFNNFGVK